MGDYIMSTIKANDIQNASGGIPTVKGQRLIPTAWVNFNGEGTVAIRDSENVSSLIDHGAGDYSVNLAVAMANNDYAIGMTTSHNGVRQFILGGYETVSSFRIRSQNGSGSQIDTPFVYCTVMGGQS